eukprot:gene4217-34482_t
MAADDGAGPHAGGAWDAFLPHGHGVEEYVRAAAGFAERHAALHARHPDDFFAASLWDDAAMVGGGLRA